MCIQFVKRNDSYQRDYHFNNIFSLPLFISVLANENTSTKTQSCLSNIWKWSVVMRHRAKKPNSGNHMSDRSKVLDFYFSCWDYDVNEMCDNLLFFLNWRIGRHPCPRLTKNIIVETIERWLATIAQHLWWTKHSLRKNRRCWIPLFASPSRNIRLFTTRNLFAPLWKTQ